MTVLNVEWQSVRCNTDKHCCAANPCFLKVSFLYHFIDFWMKCCLRCKMHADADHLPAFFFFAKHWYWRNESLPGWGCRWSQKWCVISLFHEAILCSCTVAGRCSYNDLHENKGISNFKFKGLIRSGNGDVIRTVVLVWVHYIRTCVAQSEIYRSRERLCLELFI